MQKKSKVHTNFIRIKPGYKCSSHVGNRFKEGLTNGEQRLQLKFKYGSAGLQGKLDCGKGPSYGIIIHELCHALGTLSINQTMYPIG